ncbi:unnamed protein product [Brachionus calyciflorus]|uniref:Uncharacterized protein n=1 Tax=Brachionus calyciflorus TaxID=104777 RepID=A0A814NPS3_9BILA|nr:unnamed protein product [Brachionus calyciflorus]
MKILNNSNECIKSELDLFLTPSTNTSIVSGGWFEINPTSSLSYGSPIEFRYEGSNEAGEFDNIKFSLTDDEKKWQDIPKMNTRLLNRKAILSRGSSKIELIGRLHCDIFNSDRYLINNISMNLKLIPISIDSAILLVRKAQINPSVMLGHAMALEKTSAKYPIKRVVVKQHTIGLGVSSKVISNISHSSLPSRVVIGMVTNSAYDGSLTLNAFNFRHFNLSKLNLMVDGQSSPYYKPLKFNFAENQYIRGYYSLFENIDKPVFATGNDISRLDFPNGYSLFAIDLTPDLCSGDQLNLIRSGNLDLALTFSQSLDTSIVVIIFMEYDNLVEINNKYEVSYDYKI